MRNSYSSFQDQVYREQIKKNKQDIKCTTVTFQVTDDCNLNCSYCYQINKGHHVMPFEIAKNFIDLILLNESDLKNYIDFTEFGGLVIEFIGGEPFLQVELIDNILSYFVAQMEILQHKWLKNFVICITSNGTLYFNANVQKFIKKWRKYLSLSISVDGNQQLHDSCRKFPNGEGSYELAVSAMQDYHKKYNGLMQTKMTFSPENIQYASEAIINLINIGYTDINANCIFEKGWNNSHATIFYNELKKVSDFLLNEDKDTDNYYISLYRNNLFHPMEDDIDIANWCGSTGYMIALDWKGDIYPCIRFMESSLGNQVAPLKIGTINNNSFNYTQIIQPECLTCFKNINRISQSTNECLKCNVAQGCGWCSGFNYQDGCGNFNHRATYICCMHKARSLANAYFWNKYYRKHNIKTRFKIWLSDEEALKIIDKNELQLLKDLQYPIE